MAVNCGFVAAQRELRRGVCAPSISGVHCSKCSGTLSMGKHGENEIERGFTQRGPNAATKAEGISLSADRFTGGSRGSREDSWSTISAISVASCQRPLLGTMNLTVSSTDRADFRGAEVSSRRPEQVRAVPAVARLKRGARQGAGRVVGNDLGGFPGARLGHVYFVEPGTVRLYSPAVLGRTGHATGKCASRGFQPRMEQSSSEGPAGP